MFSPAAFSSSVLMCAGGGSGGGGDSEGSASAIVAQWLCWAAAWPVEQRSGFIACPFLDFSCLCACCGVLLLRATWTIPCNGTHRCRYDALYVTEHKVESFVLAL